MLDVLRDQLAPALDAVRAGLPGRSDAAPREIRIVASSGELRLAASSQAIYAEATIDIGAGDFDVVAPAEIAEIVPRLDANVTMVPKDKTLTLKSNGSRLRLPCFPVEGFLVASFEPTHPPLTVQVDELRHALSYVQAALPSGNDPRGYFNGVLFQFDEQALTLVGSDGVMLAVIRLGVRGPAGRSWIVPTRSVAELLKLLRATSAKTLSLTLGAARLRLQLDRVSLTLACLDAVYPSWATALKRAKDGAHTIHASASAFLGACERVSLVARDDRRVQLTYSPGQVMLNTEKGGQAAEEKLTVQCEHNGVVVFDRAQLRVAAAAVAGETISLRLGGSSGPALISGEAKTQCYVLSPIKQ